MKLFKRKLLWFVISVLGINSYLYPIPEEDVVSIDQLHGSFVRNYHQYTGEYNKTTERFEQQRKQHATTVQGLQGEIRKLTNLQEDICNTKLTIICENADTKKNETLENKTLSEVQGILKTRARDIFCNEYLNPGARSCHFCNLTLCIEGRSVQEKVNQEIDRLKAVDSELDKSNKALETSQKTLKDNNEKIKLYKAHHDALSTYCKTLTESTPAFKKFQDNSNVNIKKLLLSFACWAVGAELAKNYHSQRFMYAGILLGLYNFDYNMFLNSNLLNNDTLKSLYSVNFDNLTPSYDSINKQRQEELVQLQEKLNNLNASIDTYENKRKTYDRGANVLLGLGLLGTFYKSEWYNATESFLLPNVVKGSSLFGSLLNNCWTWTRSFIPSLQTLSSHGTFFKTWMFKNSTPLLSAWAGISTAGWINSFYENKQLRSQLESSAARDCTTKRPRYESGSSGISSDDEKLVIAQ